MDSQSYLRYSILSLSQLAADGDYLGASSWSNEL